MLFTFERAYFREWNRPTTQEAGTVARCDFATGLSSWQADGWPALPRRSTRAASGWPPMRRGVRPRGKRRGRAAPVRNPAAPSMEAPAGILVSVTSSPARRALPMASRCASRGSGAALSEPVQKRLTMRRTRGRAAARRLRGLGVFANERRLGRSVFARLRGVPSTSPTPPARTPNAAQTTLRASDEVMEFGLDVLRETRGVSRTGRRGDRS